MPCDSRLVGTTLGPFEYEVDQFWTMAYAAGLEDPNPRNLDSLASGGRLVAHPVFPVCLALRAMGQMDRLFLEAGLTHDESIRRVHATQDIVFHRLISPPENLFVTTSLPGMERRRPGTYVVTRYDVAGADGAPVCTIHWGRIFRSVEMTGPDRITGEIPAAPEAPRWDGAPRASFAIPIAAGAAIVYTACARAGNPVNFHTDAAAAKRSGLPAPILMGVATLAMSVSRIIDAEAGGDPQRVARVCGRFGAMVLMPSEVTVRVMTRERRGGGDTIFFETINAEGGRAIRDGAVLLRD
jgi:acyl dehydratase